MSLSVKERLKNLGIELVSEERHELDKLIEEKTKKPCNEGVHDIGDIAFFKLVNEIPKKKKRIFNVKIEVEEKEEEILIAA